MQVGNNIADERMALKRGFRIAEQDDIFFKYMPLSKQALNLVLVTRGNQFPICLVGEVLGLGRLAKDNRGKTDMPQAGYRKDTILMYSRLRCQYLS